VTSDARIRMVALLPRLRAFAVSLSRSRTEADDLVQGACERALGSLASFREGSNFDAWMMRILRNLWIDNHRKRRGEVPLEGTDAPLEPAGDDGRKVVEARLALGDTRMAIETLPEEQRSVLVLVCVEGLSYRDAAEVLQIPVGTVMSRLARARIGLAQAMGIGAADDTAAMPAGQRQARDTAR